MTGTQKAKQGLKGISLIGYFIWWSIAGVKVERKKVQNLVKKSGLEFEVPDVCERSAFLMAKREVKSRAHANQVLIRNIKKGAEHEVALVDEKLDETKRKLGYTHSATLYFDQDTKSIRCDHPHRAFDLIKEKYEEYKIFMNSYDIRVIIMKIIAPWKKVMVRDKGGIYFIPEKFTKELNKLEAVLDQLPGDCYLQVVPQINTEKSKRAIHRSLMDELTQKIEKFNKEMDSQKFTSNKGWESQLSRFKDLRDKISFYTDALKFGAEDVEKKLDALTKKVRKQIEE
jgi:hypothetical protein